MKVLIIGRAKNKIKSFIESLGFELTEKNPELVVSFGGDGTLMKAEYLFPGVPKVILKGSYISKKAISLNNEEILKRVKDGRYNIEEIWKLEVKGQNQTFYGVNDIVVHNDNPRHAIRYRLQVNEKPIGNEIIGDGIVAATPFGSTGYYRSITDSFFELGIGLAFNNSTEQSDHIVLKENSRIRIKIVRGPAVVYADNQKDCLKLNEDDEVLIQKSKAVARILTFL